MDQVTTLVVASAVAFFLVLRTFHKLIPLNSPNFETHSTFKKLKEKYKRFDAIQLGIQFATAAGLFFAFKRAFSTIANLMQPSIDDVIILVKPFSGMILTLSLFCAILISTLLSLAIVKAQLKDDWSEYLAYLNLKYKFNYVRVSKYVIPIFALATVSLAVGVLDFYTVFGKDHIKTNGLLSLGTTTYSYEDVVEVKEVEKLIAPNGNVVVDPHYVIEFNNGENWNSRENGFANYSQDSQIIDLVLSKTDLTLIVLEFDNEE